MKWKFQLIFKTMLNPNTTGLNTEALATFLSTPTDVNNTLRSSTSTHAANNIEVRLNYINVRNSIVKTIFIVLLEITLLEL